MKKAKKLLAVILCVALLFSTASTALAAAPAAKDGGEIVARVSICSCMSIPVIAGHTYLYVQNLSNSPIWVGLYEVPVGQGVSIGCFSISVHDGWGIYYNLEAYRENRDNHTSQIWSKSRNLTQQGLEKLSKKLKDYKNHWDPFFNCAFFAYSIWNSAAGDFLIPLVIPVLSHLALIVCGGKRGVLKMYQPTRDQIFRQKGSGSGATLRPVGDSTFKA